MTANIRDVQRDALLTRDRLITPVKLGELAPAEAEAEAAKLGATPLAVAPDTNRFDPHKETHWTILMVLAWIMWGDDDQVRELWDSWREQFPGRGKATRLTWEISAAFEKVGGKKVSGKPPLSVAEVRKDLWRALEQGKVIATGRKSPGGEICTIPSVEWRWLSLPMSGSLHVQRSDSRDGYLDVVMSRDVVVKLWQGQKKSGRAQRICFDRFCEAMNASPTQKPKPKEEFIAEALDEIPALTRNAADTAWASAIEATGAKAWSLPGRPRGKTSN